VPPATEDSQTDSVPITRMLHQSLQPKMATSFEPIQESAARTMINDNLSRPDGPSLTSIA
jgi:hypothetical protein